MHEQLFHIQWTKQEAECRFLRVVFSKIVVILLTDRAKRAREPRMRPIPLVSARPSACCHDSIMFIVSSGSARLGSAKWNACNLTRIRRKGEAWPRQQGHNKGGQSIFPRSQAATLISELMMAIIMMAVVGIRVCDSRRQRSSTEALFHTRNRTEPHH